MRKTVLFLTLLAAVALGFAGVQVKGEIFPVATEELKPQLLSQKIGTNVKEELPSFTIDISNSWGSVSSDTTTIVTQMLVRGQDLSELPLSIFCSIYMNDVKMFEGQPGSLSRRRTARGTLIRFTTQIDNNSQSINEWWVSHIMNGEKTTARMRGKLKVNLRGSDFVLPFSWENGFRTDILEGVNIQQPQSIKFGLYTLQIKSLHSEWGNITPRATSIKHTLKIHNPGIIPGAPIVNKVKYGLSLNGIKMTEGSTGLPLIIWSGKTKLVTFTTELNSEKIKKWWVSHVKAGERSSYKLRYTLFVDFFGTKLGGWEQEIEGSFSTDFLGKN